MGKGGRFVNSGGSCSGISNGGKEIVVAPGLL